MPGKRKGNRRERECAELYERAGYRTYRPQESKYGETDMYGLFDMMAVPKKSAQLPDDRTRLVQVKSNRAQGIEEWSQLAAGFLSLHMQPEMVVCHDNEGWRVLVPMASSDYYTAADGRESNGDMGEGLVEYLRGGSDG